jgi:F0F1-type ATP synthase assembly protein I
MLVLGVVSGFLSIYFIDRKPVFAIILGFWAGIFWLDVTLMQIKFKLEERK